MSNGERSGDAERLHFISPQRQKSLGRSSFISGDDAIGSGYTREQP
jgi:hypothetical protein